MLPSVPSAPLEVVPTSEPLEESEESISDHSSSDEDYNLTNGTSMFGDMDEDTGTTDDFFESSQDYTPSQNIKQDMETERQQAAEEKSRARLNFESSAGIEDTHSRPELAGVEPGVINASANGDCDEPPDIRWNS